VRTLRISLSGLLLASCAGGGTELPPTPPPTIATSSPTTSSTPKAKPLDPPPLGKLPEDVRPTKYALTIEIDPSKDRFRGNVSIDVELGTPHEVIWLHGKSLHAQSVRVTPKGSASIEATYEEAHADGVAAVRTKSLVPSGSARIDIGYDAPFGKQLKGLYRVEVKHPGGATDPYAFTQFEAISARHAFPSFDEPRFKTPFEVTLRIPKGLVGIANTTEVSRKDVGAFTELGFATTRPLPTYLLCWAVGPLDVVDAKPLAPFADRKEPLKIRGVAAKGRGPELAYALAHTGEIVSTIEKYVDVGYPFDKLDIIAVPDKEGAMENPGAITFNEWLLLVDEKKAPIFQKRAYAGVMAHELAHIWFGDLVTNVWWDDIWLNEAFATWMGAKAAQAWNPETRAEITLVDRVHEAMGTDALVSARKIRQPIESSHDIQNAFDGITYQKGAGVLSMFERWVGHDEFKGSIHKYLMDHRYGGASAKEFLSALPSKASAPFDTFLEQPGVPYVAVTLACDGKPRLLLEQSRHLPLGSTGDAKQKWQVPVCARYGVGGTVKESCTLLTEKEGTLALDGLGAGKCPDWVMPNAEASGYYRFGLSPQEQAKLSKVGFPKLSIRERLALADSLWASYARGTSKAADVIAAIEPFAKETFPSLATQPMGMVVQAREWLFDDALRSSVEAYGRKLYAPLLVELGWTPKKGEDAERGILRAQVISFLASTARDPAVRKEAAKRGREYVGYGKDDALHPDAIDANVTSTALAIAVEESDTAFFDALLARLEKTEDALVRGRLLGAIASTKDPKLAERVRSLALDPRLKVSEAMSPLWTQLDSLETREATWKWIQAHFDEIVARVSENRAGSLPWIGGRFCDKAHGDEVEAFFRPRIEKLDGGPRNLASAVERVRLCIARRDAQEKSMREFFTKKK